MPVRFSSIELAFWRELLAPFDECALSRKSIGGRELVYIDKRSLANRLDTVVGPAGWFPEYREGDRGLICALSIRVPATDAAGVTTFQWVKKEDGGADESMVKKEGQQKVEDVDNNYKSEFTNAFRRAAQDAWGIGRYLYMKGIPLWLDPNVPAEAITGRPAPMPAEVVETVASLPAPMPVEATPVQPAPTAMPGYAAAALKVEALRDEAERRILFPPTSAVPVAAPAAPVAPPVQAKLAIALPAAGRGVYPWSRDMESRYHTRLQNGMQDGAAKRGQDPNQWYAWSQEIVNAICLEAIAYIKTLPTYDGAFDHVVPGAVAPVAAPVANPPATPTPAPAFDPLATAKTELFIKIASLAERVNGGPATPSQQKEIFEGAAANVLNSSGNAGEIPESLSGMTDGVWIRNIMSLVDANLTRLMSEPAAGSDPIPF